MKRKVERIESRGARACSCGPLLARLAECGHSVVVAHERVTEAECPLCEAVAQDVARVQRFVATPEFSHAAYRAWCGAGMLHLYRKAPESPTGVLREFSVADCPEVRAALSVVYEGPTRGSLAGAQ